MVGSRILRYAIAVPCLLVLILVLVFSSNAKADSEPEHFEAGIASAVEVSAISADSAVVAEPVSLPGINGLEPGRMGQDLMHRTNATVSRATLDTNMTRLDIAVVKFAIRDISVARPVALDHIRLPVIEDIIIPKSLGNWPQMSVDLPIYEDPANLTSASLSTLLDSNRAYVNLKDEDHHLLSKNDRDSFITVAFNTEIIILARAQIDQNDDLLTNKARHAETSPLPVRKWDMGSGMASPHEPDAGSEDKLQPVLELKVLPVDAGPQLALPMFSRIANPMANGSVRGDIIDYIRAHPGEHMSKIRRKLNLSSSSAVHHLRVLEKTELILAHKEGKYKRYFVNENGYRTSINGEYKSIFSILKNRNSRFIASFLISNPYSTLSDISKTMALNPSTVHWHTERLEAGQIISKVRDGKSVRYFVNDVHIVNKVLALLDS